VRVDDRWLDRSAALATLGGGEPSLTHGICPSCFKAVSARADSERLSRSAAKRTVRAPSKTKTIVVG